MALVLESSNATRVVCLLTMGDETMPFKAAPITLDDKTRAELGRRVRAGTCEQREAKRARIIVLAAEGVSSRKISKEVGMHESHVAMWRQRFLAHGLGGLLDAPRPGPPVTYGHDDRVKMAALACLERDPDDPVATWTYEELTEQCHRHGCCGVAFAAVADPRRSRYQAAQGDRLVEPS